MSECQWIFIKLGMCSDTVDIWFRIANGQFRQCSTELSARDTSSVSFPDDNLSK